MKTSTQTAASRTTASRAAASRIAASRAAASRTAASLAASALLALGLGCSSATRQTAGTPRTPAPPPSAVSSAQVRQPAEIQALDLVPEGRRALLELTADRPLVWTSFRDAEGDLVIELPNSLPGSEVGDLTRGEGLVAAVDVELLADADRPLTRLTVHTREPTEHSLTGEGEMLRIELLPVAGDTAVALAYEPVAAEEGEPPEATVEPPASAVEPPEAAAAPPSAPAAPQPVPAGAWGTADAPLPGPPPNGVAASQLYAVDVLRSGLETVVQVAGDGEFTYSTFRLESPERFVIDLAGVVNSSAASVVPVASDHVDQIRIGQFKPRPEPVSRVVFDLHAFAPGGQAPPSIERTADGLTVTFRAAVAEDVSPAMEPEVETVVSEAPPPPAGVPPAGVPPAETTAFEPPAPESEATVPEEETLVAEAAPQPQEPREPEPAMPEEVEEKTLAETVMAEPPPAEPPPAEPAAVAETVPVYEPPPEPAAPPRAAPPTPAAAPPAAPPPGPSDVAFFEAQEVQVEPPAEEVDPVLESFGALVVSRREHEWVGEPIDMSLRQADLVETLRSFATISDLNFVIQPGVSGSVTVELKGVPWDQAMTQILKINNLGVDIDGTIVRIAPLSQLRAEAEEQLQLQRARQDAVPLRTVLKSLSYSQAAAVAQLLRSREGTILSNRGTVQVDGRTNTLIIRELPDNIDVVLAVIDNLDTPEPQVMIEARVIEATKSFSRSLGIEWGYDFVADPAHGNTTGLQFPNTVTTDGRVPLLTGGATGFINMRLGSILDTFNLDARLQVAENEGLVNLVSAPRVTTLNNTSATIQSGVQIPIQTVSNRTVSVQFVNATLQLQVTPQVTAEGTIVMDINVAKRSPAPGLAIVGATNSPIQTREARTKVIVRDGGTTVIGGIYEVSANDTQDRVPGLANIPILGHLFKNRNRSNSNDELMIFITPRIIQM
jgi:type IV pilus assembly protein PilQ